MKWQTLSQLSIINNGCAYHSKFLFTEILRPISAFFFLMFCLDTLKDESQKTVTKITQYRKVIFIITFESVEKNDKKQPNSMIMKVCVSHSNILWENYLILAHRIFLSFSMSTSKKLHTLTSKATNLILNVQKMW